MRGAHDLDAMPKDACRQGQRIRGLRVKGGTKAAGGKRAVEE
jgi:hypothetical protein